MLKSKKKLKALEDGIRSFYRYCETYCEAHKGCSAWTDRGMRCPDCPKEYSEELEAHLENYTEEAPKIKNN